MFGSLSPVEVYESRMGVSNFDACWVCSCCLLNCKISLSYGREVFDNEAGTSVGTEQLNYYAFHCGTTVDCVAAREIACKRVEGNYPLYLAGCFHFDCAGVMLHRQPSSTASQILCR